MKAPSIQTKKTLSWSIPEMVYYDLNPIIQVKPKHKVSTNKIQFKRISIYSHPKGKKNDPCACMRNLHIRKK